MLDLVRQNYLEITSLALSHNLISAIGTKLLRLKLHRAFRADHNLLTDIPYDFSLLLQKYDHNVITLGYNPWTCICNAEITDTVMEIFSREEILIQIFCVQSLQEKIRDLSDIECAEGSDPDSLAGRKVSRNHSLISRADHYISVAQYPCVKNSSRNYFLSSRRGLLLPDSMLSGNPRHYEAANYGSDITIADIGV